MGPFLKDSDLCKAAFALPCSFGAGRVKIPVAFTRLASQVDVRRKYARVC